MPCVNIEKCIFFNDKMANKPGTAALLKKSYCLGDFEACARFMVCKSLGREKTPSDLFPNQTDRAAALIKQGA
ncbi:hypothetical protein [Megalodesulfovibrio paquesii]